MLLGDDGVEEVSNENDAGSSHADKDAQQLWLEYALEQDEFRKLQRHN